MSWKVRAQGNTLGMVADEAEVRRALALFADKENACEIRALTSGAHATLDGCDVDGLFKAMSAMPSGIGIYFILNPIALGLESAAKNTDIVGRRWVYIDIDPVKPEEFKGLSATDAEKESAREVAQSVHDHLAQYGWPAPVIVDSGNGVALFYRANLQNDAITKSVYSRLLGELDKKFTGDKGKIDKSVHSAAQLCKLPGTWARKGPSSDDRPHRPCRIVFVPRDIEVLTFDDLKAAAESAPIVEAEAAKTATTKDANKELEDGCARILMASKTGEGRNTALNTVAFLMGKHFVRPGVISRQVVIDRLYDAACESGLDVDDNCGPEQIRKTIESGLGSGEAQKPDPIPVITSTMGEPPAYEALTVQLSAVKPLKVQWLMRNRIAKRFITVMAGRTGIGKSFVTFDLIARISVGDEIPLGGGECFPVGGTLIISEDSHEYVIAPRLIDADADLRRIHAMSWKAMTEYHLSNIEMLDRACNEIKGGVSVVVIDPPTNFLGDTDEHKNSEVRQLVMKVVEWALSRDVAVLFILHVNKNAKGVDALNRVMGSVAWVTTSRIAHTFCPDPEDRERNLWVPMKNNLGPIEKAIAYKIVKKDERTRIEWIEEVDTNADDAMKSEPVKKRRSVVASEWLAEFFNTETEIPSKTIWDALKDTTTSENALKEAREEMGIRAKQTCDGDGKRLWVFYWPEDAKAAWDRKLNSQKSKSEA